MRTWMRGCGAGLLLVLGLAGRLRSRTSRRSRPARSQPRSGGAAEDGLLDDGYVKLEGI